MHAVSNWLGLWQCIFSHRWRLEPAVFRCLILRAPNLFSLLGPMTKPHWQNNQELHCAAVPQAFRSLKRLTHQVTGRKLGV